MLSMKEVLYIRRRRGIFIVMVLTLFPVIKVVPSVSMGEETPLNLTTKQPVGLTVLPHAASANSWSRFLNKSFKRRWKHVSVQE
jgi:hypothetical protein